MSKRNYALFYANVPTPLRDAYLGFRGNHPFYSHTVNTIKWEYLDTGQHKSVPLLLLVGGLRVADAGYQAISILQESRRIIAPTYPALNDMAALTDGLVGLLDKLNIAQVDVLSGSFGGIVAQALVQRHGGYIRKLVLSSTGLITEKSICEHKKTLQRLRLLPDWIVRRITERRLFTIMNPPMETHVFWRAYLRELFSQRLSKADIISTIACMIDFGENYSLSPEEESPWEGDVLIIGSKDDSTFGDSGQDLTTIFSSAQVFTFSKAGHSPSMTQTDVYFQHIREFLDT